MGILTFAAEKQSQSRRFTAYNGARPRVIEYAGLTNMTIEHDFSGTHPTSSTLYKYDPVSSSSTTVATHVVAGGGGCSSGQHCQESHYIA